jgi:hypothetical protein
MESQQPVEKKSGNKVLIVVGVIALVCICVTVIVVAALVIVGPAIQSVNEQVQQGLGYSGRADEVLRKDVMDAIANYESAAGCSEVSLSGGQIILSPDQTGDGSWKETWQVSACGASHLYAVTFTPSPQGGTDFAVTQLDQ